MQHGSHVQTSLVILGMLLLSASCATNVDVMREAAQGHTAVVQTMLAKGADGNAVDRDGKTALMLAAFEGHTATVQVLVANGVQTNAQDKEGTTALMLAAARGHADVVQALLAKGVDVNLQNATGQTALMLAVVGGHGQVTQVLLAKGANVELKNHSGQTALTLAQARGVAHLFEPKPTAQGQVPGDVASLVYEAEKRAREAEQKAREAEQQARVSGGARRMQETPPPRITLLEPTSLQRSRGLAVAEAELRMAGTVTEGAGPLKLFINGRPVVLDPLGRFNHTLHLTPGDNVVVLNAIDAQGRNIESSYAVRSTGPRRDPAGTRDPQLPHFGRYHALVIGNNDYLYLPKLQTAINDATIVAATLRESYSFQVTMLRDATRDKIILALDHLRASLTEDDNLLIYYAGHGTLDQEAERGYWLPVNAQPETRVNWLSTTEITDTLKAMTARHVLVVADSCYSGTLLREAGEGLRSATDQETYFLRVAQKRSRTALTSGGLEPVLDGGGGSHSVFSKAFLTTLQDNRGIMDGQQLSTQIKRLVVLNSPQTPEYSDIRYAGHDGGDFLFVRKP
jgi:uncharacterized caspase-like protein